MDIAQCCDIGVDVGHGWWGLAEVGRGHAGIESRVGPLVLLTVGVLPATGAAPNGDDVAGAAQADDVAASAAVVVTVARVE